MQARPETYFVTPHYEGHPYVLVRLENADEGRVGRSAGGWLVHVGAEAVGGEVRGVAW